MVTDGGAELEKGTTLDPMGEIREGGIGRLVCHCCAPNWDRID